ncbi:MAG TPA: GDSL-type esterase/lipase family protein [Luteitalea sp.]|nr:GDSL-type esterase/lipase family protein [Luteitalea sp.]
MRTFRTAATAATWVLPLAAAVAVGLPLARLFWTIHRGRRVAQDAPRYVRRVPGAARVLIVGDSAGVGVGAGSRHLTIAGRFGQRYPGLTIGNLARNGSRTQDVSRLLARLVRRCNRRAPCPRSAYPSTSVATTPMQRRPYRPLLIHTGANDALHLKAPLHTAAHLDVALRTASTLSEHTVVVTGGNLGLAPGLPFPLTWLRSWRQRRLRDLFRSGCARRRALYVDLFHRADDDPTSGAPRRFFAEDGVHPSAANYRLWFRAIDGIVRDADGATWMGAPVSVRTRYGTAVTLRSPCRDSARASPDECLAMS